MRAHSHCGSTCTSNRAEIEKITSHIRTNRTRRGVRVMALWSLRPAATHAPPGLSVVATQSQPDHHKPSSPLCSCGAPLFLSTTSFCFDLASQRACRQPIQPANDRKSMPHLSSRTLVCHQKSTGLTEATQDASFEGRIQSDIPDSKNLNRTDITLAGSARPSHGAEMQVIVTDPDPSSLLPTKRKGDDDEFALRISKRRSSSTNQPSPDIVSSQGGRFEDANLQYKSDPTDGLVSMRMSEPPTKIATRDDEEMAASALVSMYDDSLHDEENDSGDDMSPRSKKLKASPSVTTKKPSTKAKNKTITSLCYECGTEQTSHFRPVVSDFVRLPVRHKSRSKANFSRLGRSRKHQRIILESRYATNATARWLRSSTNIQLGG